MSGIWTLSLSDRAIFDEGKLNSWCIKTTTGNLDTSSATDQNLLQSQSPLIAIHPNPISAGDPFRFNNKESVRSFQMFTITGQQIELSNARVPDHLSEGLYLVTFTLNSGKKELHKLIVR